MRVYRGPTPVSAYTVPASGSGRWWTVFRLTSSGALVHVNRLGTAAPLQSALSAAELAEKPPLEAAAAAASPTATAAATATPAPTGTPEPAATPEPTSTPSPTDTPAPVPTDAPAPPPTETPAPTETPVPEPPDTTAPETQLTATPENPTTSDAASVAFAGSDDRTEPSALQFECSLDGAAFTACASPAQLTGLADGPHTFQVRAVDAAGNADASPASHAWTVDTTGPETTIDSGPASEDTSDSATFVFHADDPQATFACWLDGVEMGPCVSGVTYSVAPSPHEFAVQATDAAGNLEPEPAIHTWTVAALPE